MKSTLLAFALLTGPGSVAVISSSGQDLRVEDKGPQHICVHDAQTGRWTCERVFTSENGDSTW